jgi:four helix bundle protein
MGIAEEECDESLYWMELRVDAGLAKSEKLTNLVKEGNEILSMIVVSRKTARSKD